MTFDDFYLCGVTSWTPLETREQRPGLSHNIRSQIGRQRERETAFQ